MKNEMPSLLLDEKICFIRLPPDTLQNSWKVIMKTLMYGLVDNQFIQWCLSVKDLKASVVVSGG
jgi:hypothetical protein